MLKLHIVNEIKFRIKEQKKKYRRTKILFFYRYIIKVFYILTNRSKSKNIIQLASTTKLYRHPELISKTQAFLMETEKKRNLKILSFGCSTGEECITLNHYFPSSSIIGCDINKNNIKKAVKYNSENGTIRYYWCDVLETGTDWCSNFDLITAFSVLCKEPEAKMLENISKLFHFDNFNNVIAKFDEFLNIGGLIVIFNSNYRFEDTDVYGKYEVLYGSDSSFPIFDKNGQKITTNTFRGIIFKKKT